MKKITINPELVKDIEKRARQLNFKDLYTLIELVICLYIRSEKYFKKGEHQ